MSLVAPCISALVLIALPPRFGTAWIISPLRCVGSLGVIISKLAMYSTLPLFFHVAGGKLGYQFLKLRAVSGGAGQLLPEHLFAPGCLQLGKLAGEVLRPGRDAGIAVNHVPILPQNCGTEKRSLFNRLGLFQIS